MAALFSVLLASCTSAGNTPMALGMPGYAADGAVSANSAGASTESPSLESASPQALMTPEGNTDLPLQVAYLPEASPGAGFPVSAPAGAEAIAGNTPQALTEAAARDVKVPAGQADAPTDPAKAEIATDNVVVEADAGKTLKPQAYAPKKKGFFASLFGTSHAEAKPAPVVEVDQAHEAVKPVITLASAESGKPIIDTTEIARASMNGALPGVRQTELFEIKRKSGIDDESDVDLNENEDSGPYQVASAAGLARLAPNGLLKQTESVDVACLKPSLVRVLKMIEGHYGKKMIVTSGYRDPSRNRRANGARNSFHMYCAAADIQLPGVSKWELASYVRSMPGRGGVGTYCHTESVHVDVGPERDWNWRCRRRK